MMHFSDVLLFSPGVINGSEVPEGQNHQTINLAQKWVKNGFFVIGFKWPKSRIKVCVRGRFCEENGPETHFGPIFGPLPANDEKPIFDPLLCQINCLTILAMHIWAKNALQTRNLSIGHSSSAEIEGFGTPNPINQGFQYSRLRGVLKSPRYTLSKPEF